MGKREIQEINAGSMADIAFLLLIFFLVATTMDTDTGITRLLPPMPENQEQEQEVKVNKRNVLVVLINKNDELMVGGQIMDKAYLKDKAIEFFTNPSRSADLPEMKMDTIQFPPGSSSLIPANGELMIEVSKGVISLQNDRSTTYGKYLEVQNEIVAAVNQLRNDFSRIYFDKSFDELNENNPVENEIKEGIKNIYKMNISEAEPKNIGGM